jgi:hypothetical protein
MKLTKDKKVIISTVIWIAIIFILLSQRMTIFDAIYPPLEEDDTEEGTSRYWDRVGAQLYYEIGHLFILFCITVVWVVYLFLLHREKPNEP